MRDPLVLDFMVIVITVPISSAPDSFAWGGLQIVYILKYDHIILLIFFFTIFFFIFIAPLLLLRRLNSSLSIENDMLFSSFPLDRHLMSSHVKYSLGHGNPIIA